MSFRPICFSVLIAVILSFTGAPALSADAPKFTNPNRTFKPVSPEEEARLAPIILGDRPKLDKKELEKINKGKIVVRKIKTADESRRYEAIGKIDAPPKKVMEFMRNYPARVGVLPHIQEVSVEWEGNLAHVDQTLKVAFKTIRYRLDYLHYKDSVIEWEYVHGDLKDTRGYYKLFPCNDGAATILIYHVYTETGMLVPKFIVALLSKSSMPDVVEAIRGAVMKKAGK